MPFEHGKRERMAAADRDSWQFPKPEILPQQTYAPAGLALGIFFLLWGMLATWIISAIGILLVTISITAWIAEILHEEQDEEVHGNSKRE